MKFRSLLIILSIVFLIGCHTYKEYDKKSFPTYVWASGQEISFRPTIKDLAKNYNLSLGIRHMHGLQLNTIGLMVRVISPSGKESSQQYDFKIMDDKGEYVGKCAGDICDLETLVSDNFKFEETGEYTFIFNHTLEGSKIPGILEFGLIIDEK